ncbi:MAG TPA: M23 family metallopeptidase [Methylibium sp.]|nr:M23 family metallopeptidase [Methylibium sp.]
MQIIVTHTHSARTRVWTVHPLPLFVSAVAGTLALLALVGAAYHFVFLKGAREGWPVVSQMLAPFTRTEFVQRDRYLRENLDAMASKLGELQAKLLKLEAVGERVSGLAGLKPEDFNGLDRPAPAGAAASAAGGPYVPLAAASLDELGRHLDTLDHHADLRSDVFTLIESRLLEARLLALMVPSSAPVDGPVGSGFGFRIDPFTGRGALHTGLDFAATPGTPILAAAGGMVLTAEALPAYGQTVELDHGNGLLTRYAHASKLLVRAGDLVKRGQAIALVGSSGRSTGPHLHFEVLVDGTPQNPAKFLARGAASPGVAGVTAR